jgi:hypothetical protein
MKIKLQNMLVLAGFVLSLGAPHLALAVERWHFLQMTCSPELDYFSLRTIQVEHSASVPTEQLLRAQERNLMFSPDAVAKHPYDCKLQDRTISVELADYIPSHETGMCAAFPSFDVVVRIDGKQVNKFFADLCQGNAQLVEIFDSHSVHCTMPASPSKGEHKTVCERFEGIATKTHN